MLSHLTRRQRSNFWKKVRKTDGCWLWTGSINNKGYGQVRINDRSCLAHRVSFEMANGTLPAGLWVLHRCDTPACVRPDHLFSGDASVNMADCASKGRLNLQKKPRRGELHGCAKLTAIDVKVMRAAFAAGGLTKATLARAYGISPSQAGNILNGRHWKDAA